ncbi:MAG: ATP-binding protein, partial [Candidatus Rifleibacteriota bacterium]
IINDLNEYLKQHPDSHSSKLVVKEGVRSSLTCPLIADNKPIGFLFFSKNQARAYENAHVDVFLEIAEHLSLVVARTLDLERLRQLNEMKNKFLGIAAHDLRAPLALIQSYIDLINNSDVCADEEQRNYFFNKVKTTAQRMFNLINDLLDISAIESGNLQLELKPHDIMAFMKETIENHELTAKVKNIKIVGDLPKNLPRAAIDIRRLTQVVDNLISNAVKFSPKGTTITVKAEVQANFINISVIDQGQGIPEAELSKLFQEFGKTSVKPTDGEKSTGLGLAIVKKIVTGHGGKVGVTSKVGQGSTFSLTLPVLDESSDMEAGA